PLVPDISVDKAILGRRRRHGMHYPLWSISTHRTPGECESNTFVFTDDGISPLFSKFRALGRP
ncbi:hypothetical protein CHS0354_026608, partial [Potamilus streckersoni]